MVALGDQPCLERMLQDTHTVISSARPGMLYWGTPLWTPRLYFRSMFDKTVLHLSPTHSTVVYFPMRAGQPDYRMPGVQTSIYWATQRKRRERWYSWLLMLPATLRAMSWYWMGVAWHKAGSENWFRVYWRHRQPTSVPWLFRLMGKLPSGTIKERRKNV